jgi:O-antigen/teichoic acid export membrane protein
MALLFVTAPLLFGFAFGPNWVAAGDYARALIPAEFMLFVALPLTQAFFIYEKQEVALAWNLAFLAVSAGGFALGVLFGTPLACVQCYSIGSAVMYAVVIIFAFRWAGGRVQHIPGYLRQAVGAHRPAPAQLSPGLASAAHVREVEVA